MNRNKAGAWLYGLGLLSLLLVVAVFFNRSTIAAEANIPSVWYADHDAVYQVDASSHQTIQTIPLPDEPSGLAIDSSGSIWVLANYQLRKFDASSSLVFEIDLKTLEKDASTPSSIVLDPYTNRPWIVAGKYLLHVSDQAQLLSSSKFSEDILAIATGQDGGVWVVTSKQLLSVNSAGTTVASRESKSLFAGVPSYVAFDAIGGVLWLGDQTNLVQLNSANINQAAHVVSLPTGAKIKSQALNVFTGSLALATKNSLVIYDRSGAQTANLNLSTQINSDLEMVAFEPLTQAWWVGGDKKLIHLSSSSNVVAALTVNKKMKALAAMPGTIAPVLTLLGPANGSVTGNALSSIRVGLSATCSGNVCSISDAYLSGLTLNATLNNQAIGNVFVINNGVAVYTPTFRLPEGINSFSVQAVDVYGHVSNTINSSFVIDTIPPTFVSLNPADGFVTREASVTISGVISEPALVTINGNAVLTDASNGFSKAVTLIEGNNTFAIAAQDAAGNVTQRTIHLTLDTTAPPSANSSLITLGTINAGQITVSGANGSVELNATVQITNARTQGVTTATANAMGGFSAIVAVQPGDHLSLVVVDAAGNRSAAVELIVAGAGNGGSIPPDPSVNPSAVDRTVVTNVASATAFLYSGSNPIQTGVAAGTIDAKRAAVLRGQIHTRSGEPLSGVTITILNHPEFGQTVSRANGFFDLAANGGGYLTINYSKPGYLPVQRQVKAPWQDYVVAPDVVMIQLDSQSSTINLSSASPMQVARGGVVNDGDGTRQATLLFPQGTTATAVLPNGTTQPLTTLTVRATEYTIGATGPRAMPGELPATSGYTYAVEYSVDEALAAGAKSVQFSQPVYQYIDNFLNFPTGTIVPLAYYDRNRAAWVPSPNGRVVKILSVTNGAADLDLNGSNSPADDAAYSTFNVTLAERVQLASLYAVGKSLWRAPIPHFSAWDSNWGVGPPPGAEPPKVPDPENGPDGKPDCQSGSIIECQNQSLGESVPVTGTPFTLNYKSSRMPGSRATNYTLSIPISGATVPAGAKRIDVEISVAGRLFTQSFGTTPNQTYTFVWDGMDAYGRLLQGAQTAVVSVGYVYDAAYRTPADLTQSFGYNGAGLISSNPARTDMTMWQRRTVSIGGWGAPALGLGGWSLSAQHAYDPNGRVLYLGNGRTRIASELPNVVETFAGGGADLNGDGGPATAAKLVDPYRIAVGPDGTVYFSATTQIGFAGVPAIRRVDSSGIISTLALQHTGGGLDVADDGSVYLAETNSGRVISRLTPDGGYSIVISNDMNPSAVKVGPDGNVYHGGVFFSGASQIRTLDPSGSIVKLASGDSCCAPTGVGVDASGAVYWSEVRSVYRVNTDGTIERVAGDGFRCCSDTVFDGAVANQVGLDDAQSLAVDADGTFYIGQESTVRKVKNGKIYNYVTGISRASGVALGHQGEIYVVSEFDGRVLRVRPPLPKFTANDIDIVSDDGTEVYHFDPYGRHLRTLDAKTGAVRLQFSYDSNGFVTQVQDGDGNITRIERDSSGNPTAIISPDGLRTAFTLDSNGYLASITNPANEATKMVYTADGLLTTFTNGRNLSSTITYDAVGRLIKDQNAAGGFWQLARTDFENGNEVSMTSALGRAITYRTELLSSGVEQRTNTFADGTRTVTATNNLFGSTTTTGTDGTVTTTTSSPDPRFGTQAPLVSSGVRLPSGLTSASSVNRSVSLSDPGNLLSLITQTDTVVVNGKTSTAVYTASTRQNTSTTPEGRQVVTTTDTFGRPTKVQVTGIDPIGYVYDTRGRLGSITQGSGPEVRTATMNYNPQGFLASVIDASGRTESFVYDNAGRVTQQNLPDGRAIQFSYDANGNVTSISPPGRPAHGFSYSSADLEEQYTPPAVSGVATPATQYAYNLDKQLTTITRPDGQIVSFSYDAGGRLATTTLPDRTITHGYSATTGQLTNINTSSGINLSYAYDGFLPLSETLSGPVTGVVVRTYDNDFQITGISVNGVNVGFGHDNDKLLTQAGDLAITRDVQNGLVTGTALGLTTTSQSYNSFGEVSQFTAAHGGSALFNVQYTRDKLGRIATKTETVVGDSPVTYTYTYDAAGRLTQVTKDGILQASYGYDSNGNRLGKTDANGTVSGTYDNQDRLLTYGGNSYTYTANGDLWTKTNGTQTTTYTYDAFGNLTRVALPNGSVVDYLIDGQNRRIGKRVNGSLMQGFLYQDGLRPIAELDGNGNIVARFVYGLRSNVPEYIIKGGNVYRIVADHLGSPRLVVNTSNGNVEQRLDYDEFGDVIIDSNPGFQPFGFAGGLYDRESKLIHFGAREYDPQIGRWVSKDPIKFSGRDPNLYGYVMGDPINYVDANGKFPLLVIVPVVGGVIGAVADAIDAMRQCNAGIGSVLSAAGRGFVSGAVGSLVGLGVASVTGNPLLAGSAGGLAGNLTDQFLAGGDIDPIAAAVATAGGGIGFSGASNALPLVGRTPSLLISRNASNLGPNSLRLIGQEGVGDTVTASAVAASAGGGCGCK